MIIKKLIMKLRIRLEFWDLGKKMTIPGIVRCSCGGNIISNTGKVSIVFDENDSFKYIACWSCGKYYNANEAFYQRRENKIVEISQ